MPDSSSSSSTSSDESSGAPKIGIKKMTKGKKAAAAAGEAPAQHSTAPPPGPGQPYELSFAIKFLASTADTDNLQVELSYGDQKSISPVANNKTKAVQRKGKMIYKFLKTKGMLTIIGKDYTKDTVAIRLLPIGKEQPALPVASLELGDGATEEKELDIGGDRLKVYVSLVVPKPGLAEPPRQPPRLGAPIPFKLYKGIPEHMWDGLFMDGPFVARSEIGPVPVIISVPHDGKMKSSDPERVQGRVIPDLHTMEIGLTAYQTVKEALGAPTIVTQLLNRHWVDVNRGRPNNPILQAYDGPDGADAYWTFHHSVQDAIAEYKNRGQVPLIIDVHGTANPILSGKVDAAFGKGERTFMPGLQKTYGDVHHCMWTAPNALLKLLKENGVIPHEGKNVFSGGFTVVHCATKHCANSMQIEFDTQYRKDYEAGHAAGIALGKALAQFLPDHPCPV